MFKKAEAQKLPLKMALSGPSGSGKTYTALKIMSELTNKIAFLDTENNSALRYADEFDFDHAKLDGNYSIDKYTKAIKEAEKEGYEGIILDSASHGWEDAGGALDRLQTTATQKYRGNTYAAWKDITPSIKAFLNAIVRANIHVIACFRVKTEYADVEINGKKTKQKIGVAPVFKEGAEYDFDLVATLDLNHSLGIEKIRQGSTIYIDDGILYNKPGGEFADMLKKWLNIEKGEKVFSRYSEPQKQPQEDKPSPAVEKAPDKPAKAEKVEQSDTISEKKQSEIVSFCKQYNIPRPNFLALIKKHGYTSVKNIEEKDYQPIMDALEEEAGLTDPF